MSTARVDPDRLWTSLEEISARGSVAVTPGGAAGPGLHRLAGSPEDGAARGYVVEAAREVGCRVRIDPVGNVFLRRPGLRPEDPAVLLGSHLDSQPAAGRYDGTYGVMAGLEVLRALGEAGVATRRPVELVIWTNEEGARFAPAMMGSSVFGGRLLAADALAATDAEGVTLAQALAGIGYLGTDVVSAAGESVDGVPRGGYHAYLEAHIEQGPLLEGLGLPIGVVTGAQAQYWTLVRLTGDRAHAGTFPMEQRHDALVAAAELVGAVRSIGLARPGLGRATVGRLTVAPNTPNVVPGEVELVVELRHPIQTALDKMLSDVLADCRGVADRHGVRVAAEQVLSSPPTPFDAGVMDVIEAASHRCGLRSHRMVSGAGHDAVPVSGVIPTGMLFIPCRGGVSHAPAEAIEPGWAADGARVLLEAVQALAQKDALSDR